MNKLIIRLSMAAHILRYGQLPIIKNTELPTISSADLSDIKQFFPMPKFFVFGHARSGTTLLARLIRLHPEVHCNWQAHFFTRKPLLRSLVADPQVANWLIRKSNRWNRGVDLAPVVLRATADYILERDARAAGKSVVGDKSPNSLLDDQSVREMHAIYPDAKLIFIIRDGRDVLISHRFQNFIDAPQHLSSEDKAIRAAFEAHPDDFFTGERSIFTPKGLEKAAQGWVRNVIDTDRVARELYDGQYIRLKFEDILTAPTEQLSTIWKFLSVEPSGFDDLITNEISSNPDADWQRKKANDLVANLEKGKRGSWRDLFTKNDKQVVKRIAGKTLVDLGYEQGLDW